MIGNEFDLRHNPSKCTACGKEVDAATATQGGDEGPTEGSLSICFYCQHVMMFDKDLQLQDLSVEMWQELKKDPWFQGLMKSFREAKAEVDNERSKAGH